MLLLLTLTRPGHAQRLLDFAYTDSLTHALLDQRRYVALDSVGQVALGLGADYPALRRRLGAGALASGHPAAALRYYGPALHENPLDVDARIGLATAYLALNRPGPAALVSGALSDSLRRALGLPGRRAVVSTELEASVLSTAEQRRGTASYGRLGVSSRLSARLSLSQHVSYYAQTVEQPRPGSPGAVEKHDISQGQYSALLSGQLTPQWQVKAGYNYITPDLGHNHLGYLALAYARPQLTVQAGLYAGVITDTARTQADLRLTVYPLGNLNLYGFGRGSVVSTSGQGYTNVLLGAGGRLRPWLWAEAWGCAGLVPVLAEADGTYVYNLLDPLRRRAAASLLILAPRHASVHLVYGMEQRSITRLNLDYTLHLFSAALTWTW
ncbi:MAG: tetratricopeptide repeat protein [Janthinobacterium lividum]